MHLRDRFVVKRSTVPQRELALVITREKTTSIWRPLKTVRTNRVGVGQLTFTTRVGERSLLIEV